MTASQHINKRFKNMTLQVHDLVVSNDLTVTGSAVVSADTTLADDVSLVLGTDSDVELLFSTGDADNDTTVLALANANQAIHVTDVGAKATDWNVAADTHPTLYIHSNTTPATDYITIGAHDGTVGHVNVVGGTTLALDIAGTTEAQLTASVFDLASTDLQMQTGGKILDNNGNELLIFALAASAVNELTITNAATGNPVLLTASGETDVSISIAAKGAGYTRVTTGGLQVRSSAAVTATADGTGTGLIPAGTSLVIVTSDSVNKQISLPIASVGDRIRILVGATGCELISAVAAHKVNNVTVGATNELALTAASMYDCQYLATNTWIVVGYTYLGAVEAALVPDSL